MVNCPTCNESRELDNGNRPVFKAKFPCETCFTVPQAEPEQPHQLPLDLRLEFERQSQHLAEIRLAS